MQDNKKPDIIYNHCPTETSNVQIGCFSGNGNSTVLSLTIKQS